MSQLSKLTEAQQLQLKLAPFWSFMHVSYSDGNMDEKEYEKFVTKIADISSKFDAALVNYSLETELSLEIFAAIKKVFETLTTLVYKSPKSALENLKELGTWLSKAVSAGQASTFKTLPVSIAQSTAEASGDKWSFILGNVSKAESEAIGQIKKALQMS